MPLRTHVLITAGLAASGLALAGCGDPDAALREPPVPTVTMPTTGPVARASVADSGMDVDDPAVDIVKGEIERRGGVVRVTITVNAPVPRAHDAPPVAYSAVIEHEKESWLAVAQVQDGTVTYRLQPQAGSPGREISGSVDRTAVRMVMPEGALGGPGPLHVSFMARNGAPTPAQDSAPDNGWPGPGRVTVP